MATAKLCQIVAAESHRKTDLNRKATDLYHKLQKGDLFTGQTREYEPLDVENGVKYPNEHQKVQLSAEDVLRDVSDVLTQLFDVTATKDYGNMLARADVVVDGETLIKDAPVPYLLWLEKQLTDLHTIFKKIPVHDPGQEWTYDGSTNLYRSKPSKGTKTEKTPQHYSKAAATDKHAEQVEFYWKDDVIGYWTTTRFTGALPASRVRELCDRVLKLHAAVAYAREEANSTVVTDQTVGRKLFDFLLA